jgi:nicotinamidase-related amidase
MKPRLLAVMGALPDLRNPSGRVIRRHLLRFIADGWEVVATDDGHYPEPSEIRGCRIISLPSRRRFWPPVRTSFSSACG